MAIQTSDISVSTRQNEQSVDVGPSTGGSIDISFADSGGSAPVESSGGGYSEAPSYGGESYSQTYDTGPSGALDQMVAQGMSSMPQAAPQAQQQRQPQPQQQRQQEARRQAPPSVSASAISQQPVAQRSTARRDQAGSMASVPSVSIPGGVQASPMSSRQPRLHSVLLDVADNVIGPDPGITDEMMSEAREMVSYGTQSNGGDATPVSRTSGDAVKSVADAANPDLETKPSSPLGLPVGWRPKGGRPRTKEPSRRRSPSVKKRAKSAAKAAFNREGIGVRIYGKVLGKRGLGFRDVGIGVRELASAMSQDTTTLDSLLSAQGVMEGTVEGMGIDEVVDLINSSEVYVGTSKPPNNRGEDVQRRRLRVLTDEQRGIFLHPIMAAMYTADYDGDDMQVFLDPDVRWQMNDPMAYMVGFDGSHPFNMDFLPVSRIMPIDGMSEREYVRQVIFSSFAGIDGRTIRSLVDAVLELGESYDGDDRARSDAYARVFREARNVADDMSGGVESRSDAMTASLCDAVYRGMRDLAEENAIMTIGTIVDESDLPDPVTPDDFAVRKVLDGMVNGSLPANFQELKVIMNGFLGNVSGKNAPFRFSADVGKMMKIDSRLQVGEGWFEVDSGDTEQMQSFFESTLKYAASLRMAKDVKVAGRSEYYNQKMRDLVIRDVGFPDSQRYETYKQFLDAFAESYHRHSSTINEANLVFLSNMGIANDSNRGIVSPLKPSQGGLLLADLAEPLRSVYGTYSVGRMFSTLSTSGIMGENVDRFWHGTPSGKRAKYNQKRPYEREYDQENSDKFWITGKYLSYNLNQFVRENRLVRGSKKDSLMSDIRQTKLSDLDVMSDIESEFFMLMSLADKRTGTASKFNEKTYGLIDERHDKAEARRESGEKTTVEMMGELMSELVRIYREDGSRRDQVLWVNDIVSALQMSGPDMFTHFGMDSADGFLKSKWARAMARYAGNPEVLGGIRTAMVFDYRMSDITRIESSLTDPDNDVDQYRHDFQTLSLAKDELAASSEVWHGIIREFEAEDTPFETSAFKQMMSGKSEHKRDDDKSYIWTTIDGSYDNKIEMDAKDFWMNPGNHTTLRSVIEDLDLDRKTKWSVITDVVRYWEHDAYLKSYEVGLQLEIGKDSSYSLVGGATQGALRDYGEFSKSFNRWSRQSQESLQKEVDDAAKKYRRQRGSLTRALSTLAERPWSLVAIDDHMFADSIMSVLDKTYAQTEKASQHPWTNAVYSALSYQINGGYMNDVTRTDDRLVGTQSTLSVSAQDVVRLLSDGDFRLEVYNEYGERGTLDRETLLTETLGRDLSGDMESDIWDFLVAEPRIASAIRQHNACVKSDTDGGGYLGSTLSMRETIQNLSSGMSDDIGHVKYLMRDRPLYAAVIALATPMHGAISRNARDRVVETEGYLCRAMCSAAFRARRGGDPTLAAEEILSSLGITNESIRGVMRSDYDIILDTLGLPVVDDEVGSDNDADQIWLQARGEVEDAIRLIASEVQPATDTSVGGAPSHAGIDIESCASFWDVVQELSGAKTAVSTGIEGKETYDFAVWASHISARDGYADLDALLDDDATEFGMDWDGAWTSMVREDGSPILLEVDESGTIANLEEIEDAQEAASERGDRDECVVRVPDGYDVRDRSTDSYGNPLSSLFAYMVSKRSNGAEAFNLKAKKAGIDGRNSIVKMRGKYRMVENADGDGPGLHMASIEETELELRDVARTGGMDAARLRLAEMLAEENEGLGYKDLTLSNYVCIADLMLIEGDDGQLYLRSLEMLFNAIKHRLGTAVDEMTDDQIREAADAIVGDVSGTAVGRARMASPVEALDEVRPASKSSSVSGVRLSSSVFERNYNLMEVISEHARMMGVTPMSQARASQLNKRYASKDAVAGVSEIVQSSPVAKSYNVVGYAGSDSGEERVAWSVGPSSAIVIGSGSVSSKRVAEICDQAGELGMTVIVSASHASDIPSYMVADAMPINAAGDVLLPCFDMRLNGAESGAYAGGRFSIFQAPYSDYVTSVEDSVNEFELGDAEGKITRRLRDDIRVTDSGSELVKAEDMFPNVFRNPAFSHCLFTVGFASGDEIGRIIAAGEPFTVDYGVVEGGHGFDQRRKDVDAAIDRYRQRYQEANGDGMMMSTEVGPGDIVAWAEVEIYDQFEDTCQYVFAPIIPFPLHGPKKGVPETFSVQQVATVDNDNTLFSVDWTNRSIGGYAKYFDSSGGANKEMVSLDDVIDEDRTLADGTPIGVYIAKPSTNSRKVGTDRRIKTMITLMAKARMRGYNFAMSDGAFPESPDHPENGATEDHAPLRERLAAGRVPRSEWVSMLRDRDMLFCVDDRLNVFLNVECRKILENGGNPSDYLASYYEAEDGTRSDPHVMWEFECMFDQGLNYEDSLLRFLHYMDETFCPDGIDDDGEYLFRLAREGNGIARGYDRGVLQMQTPHRSSSGQTYYLWDNVYIGRSFLGEDYSGFSRPNTNGASNFLDAMNTMSYRGVKLDNGRSHDMVMWATSDLGRRPKDGGAIGRA